MPASSAPLGAALALVCAATASACAPAVTPTRPLSSSQTVRIVFVGDSLIRHPAREYGMLDRIRDDLAALHPDRGFEVVDASVNGDRIADIYARLERDVVSRHPDAVVLYWDSDVSDVDEDRKTPGEVKQLRAAYEGALLAVASRLLVSGAHVVMSGPTVIGEQPRRLNKKDAQIAAYRAINRRVASSLKIAYVDSRRAFLARRPAAAPASAASGLLTEDGEHPNAIGAGVLRTLFVRALDGWLRRTAPAKPGSARD